MKNEKTIDGLTVRGVVKKTTQKKPAKQTKKAIKPVPQKHITEEKAREAFLEPVEAFDYDVTSEEIKDEVKEFKKELKKKEKKPRKKITKIIEGIILAIVILLIGGIIWLLVWGNDLIAKLTGGRSGIWSAIGTLTSENYTPLKTDENGRTNILIFGTSGYDMSGSEGKGTHAGSQLTDSIMVVSLDQESGDIAMVSLPRDLKVSEACSAGKINEVYWCNNKNGNTEEAGAKALEKSVANVFGISFQYYVHVNWMSLESIVDSIGGITVTLDEDINDRNYTKTVIKAGVPTTLNGAQALGLARARHGTTGGDFSRGTSQQKILIAIKDKLVESGVSMTRALELLNILGDNVRTDFTTEDLKTGVHIISDFDLSAMRQVAVLNYTNPKESYMTTANINGISYVIPSAGAGVYTDIQKYIAKEFSSDPIKREDANILVLNGSGQSGVATTLKTSLESEGYKVGKADNAPDGEYTEKYYIYNISGDKTIGTAKALAGEWNVEIKDNSTLPSGISTKGYDIVVIIGGKTTE